MTVRRLAVLLVALLIAGCGSPAGPSVVVLGADPDDPVIAELYAAALRYYGTPTHVEATTDPLAALDAATVRVVPGFTGDLLSRFDPDAPARADEQVYRDLLSALPEGIAAGDYTTSAEDKPAVALTEATAEEWGGRDLTTLTRHCDGLRVGAVGDLPRGAPLRAVGRCQLPAPREFLDAATLFAALANGAVDAAWTTTAAPDIPEELVVLSDRTALIRAQNLVPLYRRNELTEQQVLALNQIAGVLDTAALAEMRSAVAAGGDPATVATDWLNRNPPGR